MYRPRVFIHEGRNTQLVNISQYLSEMKSAWFWRAGVTHEARAPFNQIEGAIERGEGERCCRVLSPVWLIYPTLLLSVTDRLRTHLHTSRSTSLCHTHSHTRREPRTSALGRREGGEEERDTCQIASSRGMYRTPLHTHGLSRTEGCAVLTGYDTGLSQRQEDLTGIV